MRLDRLQVTECFSGDQDHSDGEVLAIFVCCDTPFPYLDKYSTILDAADFIVPGTGHDED
jgi:hypothetical protein